MAESTSPSDAGGVPEMTLRMTPEQMRGLLAAGSSRVTRALRQWEPPEVDALQKLLPQYEITAFIARGGMGAVYKAKQRALGRAVAIKILPPDIVDDDLDYAERFKREARAMASLSHPNIVTVHEAGEVVLRETGRGQGTGEMSEVRSQGDAQAGGKLLYFVMEFIEGTDLAQLVRSAGRLDTERALDITRQVCEALAFAHAGGIVHRDIKPSNIMIDKSGHVKVADFGLARMDLPEGAGQLTGGGVALGTPDYMAPETLSPLMPVDQRADLYAVGVMLYQMLTGDVPRGRFPLPSVVVPGIDARLDAIVERAMQTDREQRYSSAVEMRRDVARVGSSGFSPSAVAAIDGLKPELRTKRRSPRLAATVIILGAGGWFMWKNMRDESLGASSPAALISPTAPQGPHWSQMPTEAEKKLAFTNTLGMKFVPVPGTEVLFCIHETRKKDYAAYAAETPGLDISWKQATHGNNAPTGHGDDHPVVSVSWEDAQAFCVWLGRKDGRRYRLPTDREWSWAVGIGERESTDRDPIGLSQKVTGVHPWGTDWPPPARVANLSDKAFLSCEPNGQIIEGYEDGFATTAPVMSFAPNALGIHDLSGNVWEWCEDQARKEGETRTARGGAFDTYKRPSLLSSYRVENLPGYRHELWGFRIVVEKQP